MQGEAYAAVGARCGNKSEGVVFWSATRKAFASGPAPRGGNIRAARGKRYRLSCFRRFLPAACYRLLSFLPPSDLCLCHGFFSTSFCRS